MAPYSNTKDKEKTRRILVTLIAIQVAIVMLSMVLFATGIYGSLVCVNAIFILTLGGGFLYIYLGYYSKEAVVKQKRKLIKQQKDIAVSLRKRNQQISDAENQKHKLKSQLPLKLQKAKDDNHRQIEKYQKKISDADKDLEKALSVALINNQQAFVHSTMRNARIEEAKIKGIGPKFVEKIQLNGMHNAADVSRARLDYIKGMGDAKVQAVMNWKASVEYFANTHKPSSLSKDEINSISQSFLEKKQKLGDAIIAAESNLPNALAAIQKENDDDLMRLEEESERFKKDISVLQINDQQVKEQLSSYNNIVFWRYLKEGTGEKSNTAIIIAVAALAGLFLQSGMGAWSSTNYVMALIPTATSTITPTFTRTNTFTLTSTYTPSITYTPSLTFTSTTTLTPTITLTPSFTSTLTKTITPSRTFPSISGISCIPDNERVSANVTRVIDGDTIEVNISGKIYPLRYIGIDTPENTTTSEYYGSQATKLNQKLVEGKTVILVNDVSETDRYDRLLRYVIVGNKFVNYELVKIGAAIAANYPPDSSCSSMFYSAMVEAQSSEVGMWRPTPVPAPTSSGRGGSGGGGGLCNCAIDYNCDDFSTHAQAQSCFNSCDGSPSYNWAGLDRDRDGSACEALP